MQAFAIAPANPAGQRNYVFVDEHNRHKRLKVMRACEGCRRRKIKCDAASTNTWPCSACTRLKLHCIPPTGGNDRDFNGTGSIPDSEEPVEYGIAQTQGVNAIHSQPQSSQQYANLPTITTTGSLGPYSRPDIPYQLSSYPYHPEGFRDQYLVHNQGPFPVSNPAVQASHPYFPPQPQAQVRNDSTVSSSESEHTTTQEISEALGQLKIEEIGIAPYTRQQGGKDPEPDGPVHDDEVKLPPMSNTAGSQIRIPPALMPTDEDALHYFKVFFADVHPYMPVVIRAHFYQQWHTNQGTISPLLLEAIFACAGRMSDDPAQGAQWLALANRHEECFLDKPRLSTLQALLLLLKAREAAPKRGYYYRSWMTCKTIVSMAKDLDLHEHYTIHAEGRSCGSDPIECLTKTRIWQTVFVCEIMVGGPQGRVDFGVDPHTIDIRLDPPCSDIDDFEASHSRRYAYFVRNARNIRLIADAAHRVKKKKDWGLDSQLVAYNVAFSKWPDELPPDLQLSMPADGSPPWLPTHFIGNMHSHYHLGVVMLHRAQLVASQSFATDSAWRHHMSVCYNSAKLLCRLQEAVLEAFGLSGLLCMLRGISFTLYSTLTCTMVHLIAITSPDPAFHRDAREYFTRHMRLLEQCISAWPMPELEAQINALRVAFSANIDKPFELKLTFPYDSPSDPYQPSPPLESQYHPLQIPPNPQYDQQGQFPQPSQTLTPPISAGATDSRTDSPQYPTTYVQPHAQSTSSLLPHNPLPVPETVQWNPTPIIDQWNTAFAIPPSAMAPPSNHSQSPSSGMPVLPHTNRNISPSQTSQPYTPVYPSQTTQPVMQQQTHYFGHQAQPSQYQPAMVQQSPGYVADLPIFVTPKDWQQSVASVFDASRLKRRWDYNPHEDPDGRMQKRQG